VGSREGETRTDGGKRRVEIDKVNAVRFHAFEDFEIVAED
jgi:hypothetical protein